jgi:hypothetical protein
VRLHLLVLVLVLVHFRVCVCMAVPAVPAVLRIWYLFIEHSGKSSYPGREPGRQPSRLSSPKIQNSKTAVYSLSRLWILQSLDPLSLS